MVQPLRRGQAARLTAARRYPGGYGHRPSPSPAGDMADSAPSYGLVALHTARKAAEADTAGLEDGIDREGDMVRPRRRLGAWDALSLLRPGPCCRCPAPPHQERALSSPLAASVVMLSAMADSPVQSQTRIVL
ncbi:hypothetical protein GCM10009612_64710 [Streptomyces beijiangensis]